MPSARTVSQSTRTALLCLIGALACDVLSLGLLFSSNLSTSVLGYVLAPFAVTALIGFYRYVMIEMTQNLDYRPTSKQRRQGKYVIAVLIAAFLIGLAHSWIIATEIAKGMSA
jgi:hypothetical protein